MSSPSGTTNRRRPAASSPTGPLAGASLPRHLRRRAGRAGGRATRLAPQRAPSPRASPGVRVRRGRRSTGSTPRAQRGTSCRRLARDRLAHQAGHHRDLPWIRRMPLTPTRSAPARISPSSSSRSAAQESSSWPMATTRCRGGDLAELLDQLVGAVADDAETSRFLFPSGRTPFMISNSASSPASLWARSITTETSPSRSGCGTVKKFIRPGFCEASGRNVVSPRPRRRAGSHGQCGRLAASVFSTWTRRPASSARRPARRAVEVAVRSQHRHPAVDQVVARPVAEGLADAGLSGSRENTQGSPRPPSASRRPAVSASSTAQPSFG